MKVLFKFIEGGIVHSLPWIELLTMDETTFECVDELAEDVNVMAPWYDNSVTFTGIRIRGAEGAIVPPV